MCSKKMHHSRPNFQQLCYRKRIEIFMGLRDIDVVYSIDRNGKLKPNPKKTDRFVILHWKPPGCTEYVEKFRTEVLLIEQHLNMVFSSKAYVDYHEEDKENICLKFQVSHWGSTEVTVEKLTCAGAKGLDIPLALCLDPGNKEIEFACSQIVPARLFLRARSVNVARQKLVSIQFGLQLDRTKTLCFPSFPKSYLEMHYLNEMKLNESETPFPYTLAVRSNSRQNSSYKRIRLWKPLVLDSFDLNCEKDLDACLKIELHPFGLKKMKLPYKYFYFTTTLRQLICSQDDEGMLNLPLWSSKGRICKRVRIIVNNVNQVPIPSLDYYGLKKGLIFKYMYFPIMSLPIAFETLTVVDELMKMIKEIFQGLAEGPYTIICNGTENSEDEECTKSLVQFSSSDFDSLASTYRNLRTKYKCNKVDDQPPCAPILREMLEYCPSVFGAKGETNCYVSIFLFTNGRIFDAWETVKTLGKLSEWPVSVFFVVIDSEDLSDLQTLEKWVAKMTRETPSWRNIVHILYFNNKTAWENSITSSHYGCTPGQIFGNECVSTICSHFAQYLIKCGALKID